MPSTGNTREIIFPTTESKVRATMSCTISFIQKRADDTGHLGRPWLHIKLYRARRDTEMTYSFSSRVQTHTHSHIRWRLIHFFFFIPIWLQIKTPLGAERNMQQKRPREWYGFFFLSTVLKSKSERESERGIQKQFNDGCIALFMVYDVEHTVYVYAFVKKRLYARQGCLLPLLC